MDIDTAVLERRMDNAAEPLGRHPRQADPAAIDAALGGPQTDGTTPCDLR